MGDVITLLVPAIIFIFVAGVGILLVLFWSRNFGARHQSLARRLQETADLRATVPEDSLRSRDVSQSSLMDWVDARLLALPQLQLLLIRAGSSQTPARFLVLTVCFGFFSAFIAFAIFRVGPLIVLGTFVVTLLLPCVYFMRKASTRRLKFEDQLPDALDFITRSLRAGHGLTISMGMAADELPEPVGTEFKITFDEINFGIPFTEAMANLTVRINSPDLSFFTIAVVIQRETGGNLTELLASLSRTIRERIKLRGKVRVLAAEGKFSGYLLGGLPIVLGMVLNALNPQYMSPLWYTETGHGLVRTGLIMLAIGAGFMFKITQIKV